MLIDSATLLTPVSVIEKLRAASGSALPVVDVTDGDIFHLTVQEGDNKAGLYWYNTNAWEPFTPQASVNTYQTIIQFKVSRGTALPASGMVDGDLFSLTTAYSSYAKGLYWYNLDHWEAFTPQASVNTYQTILNFQVKKAATLPVSGMADGDLFHLTQTQGSNLPGLYWYNTLAAGGAKWEAFTQQASVTNYQTTINFQVKKAATLPISGMVDGDLFHLTQADGANLPGMYWYNTLAAGGAQWEAFTQQAAADVYQTIINFQVKKGPAFPVSGMADGDLFHLTAQSGSNLPGLYWYNTNAWEPFTKAAAAPSIPYDVGGYQTGKPGDNAVMMLFLVPTGRAFTLPQNLANSRGRSLVAATASTAYVLKKNGLQFATMVFAAGATTATFNAAAATSFVAGDYISVHAPATADATQADVIWTLASVLSS